MDYHALTTDIITGSEKAHLKTVRERAGECVVVLKNNGFLPITSEGPLVALFGRGARHTIKGGTGSGDVNSRTTVTIEQGLINAGFKITGNVWLDRFDTIFDEHIREYLDRIGRKAEEMGIPPAMVMFTDAPGEPVVPGISDEDIASSAADTAIYIISRNSGEGGDRFFEKGDYLLTDTEVSDIKKISLSYEHTVVLLNVGGIIDAAPLMEIDGIDSILLVSQLGAGGGDIIADVLTGRSDPSGRLTDTWAKRYDDYPGAKDFSHNNGDTDDEYYNEGIYIGYRYFDSFSVEPLFPFGFGLGYTAFEMTSSEVELNGSRVTVRTTVLNTGDRAGRETVQVYVSAPEGRIDKPYQELRAYKKSPLIKPGENAVVETSFDMKDCASFSTGDAARILEKGCYLVRVGRNSRDTSVAAVISVGEDIITEKLSNLLRPDADLNELKNPGRYWDDDISGIKVLELDASSVSTYTASYTPGRPGYEDKRAGEFITFDDVVSGNATVEELVAQLDPEALGRICCGEFESDYLSELNIVGSASLLVPGAAAESTSKYEDDRKIPKMILADGPAGLRLQPHFIADGNGERIIGGEIFGLCFNPFPENLPEDTAHYYQYCTAIPIATALAQSWDLDYIEDLGKIVGDEANQFFVHFWLAPGMNIHRNPLCGRNFEYYSEDPLIAGMCAAYDTKGVQSHKGVGTTIKHFACNNQEDNRMFSNSHVSERALRDLYLRGFEIAVKESSPMALMTSYNLLNGIHTANNRELITNVMRDEWGFDGVVMTDWFTTQDGDFQGEMTHKYHNSTSAECIAAGNDWIMPGMRRDVDNIKDALDKGKLKKGELQFCAANVLRAALKCFG